MAGPLLFAPGGNQAFAKTLAENLGVSLAGAVGESFADGEHQIRLQADVRGRDAILLLSQAGDGRQSVNDKLTLMLFCAAALRDAGAGSVTAVMPYLSYARQDRRVKQGDALTLRHQAQLFEAMGVDRVMAMDVHNVSAFENAFRCETVNMEAGWAMARELLTLTGDLPLAVVSPDAGGAKRAERLRDVLEQMADRPVRSVLMEKRRRNHAVSGSAVTGDTSGCAAIIIDDLIAGGSTMMHAVEVCRAQGAERVIAAATHGVFTQSPDALLAYPGLDRLLMGNTIPWRFESLQSERLQVVPMEPVIADAIRRHTQGRYTQGRYTQGRYTQGRYTQG